MSPSSPTSSPLSVKAAIVSMAVNWAAGFSDEWQDEAFWARPDVLISLTLTAVLLFFILRGLYLGQKAAFWLIILPTCLSFFLIPSVVRTMAPGYYQNLYFAQGALQLIVFILLLLPSSRRWFFPRQSS